MVIQLDGASLLKRVLCLLLIAILLLFSIGMPMAEAVFVESAAVAYAYELIAAALVAGGFVVANSDDLISVSAAVYKWAKDKADPLCDTLLGIARQALSFAGDITSTAWRMSTQAWDAICDAISGIYSSGSTVLPVTFTATVQQYMQNSKLEETFHPGIPGTKTLSTSITITDGKYLNDLYTCELIGAYCVVYRNGTKIKDFESQGGIFGFSMEWVSSKYYQIVFNTCKPDLSYATGGGVAYNLDKYDQYDVIVHNLISSSAVPVPTMTYPGTMTMAPPLPTTTADPDTGKEVVVFPPLSVYPDDWTADWPKTDTGEQVDVPTDTLVDVGTGEKVDTDNPDVPDENTNIFQRFWDWIKGLLQSILDAIKAIASAIVGFFDSPSDFRLDFDGFKNLILPERFPFCIPFDLVNSVRVFSANAQDFSFRIDFDTKFFSVHHAVDLTPFVLPIAFFRYTCVIWFCWVLITRTRDMIKW